MVDSFIYSTSYQTENSTLAANSKGQHCVFFCSGRCVLSPRGAGRRACPLSFSLTISPLSTKQELIQNQNLCKGHSFGREGKGEALGGRCGLIRRRPAPTDWLGIWSKGWSTRQGGGRRASATGQRGEWTTSAGPNQSQD